MFCEDHLGFKEGASLYLPHFQEGAASLSLWETGFPFAVCFAV